MKKAGQLLAVLTAASVLLSGCEKLKDVTTTSVYVSKNGVVTEAIVEDYSKDDDYTEDELKVFVEDDIKKFTEERGDADSVKLEKCQIKEDKVEIRMEYGDYQSYADYHGAEFFAGTLDEAEEAGYDFSASFVDSKGNEVSVEDAVKGVKHVRVIVCEEPPGNRNGRSGALRFRYSRDQRKKHGGYGRRVDHKVHRECFCVIIRAD